MDSEFDEKYLQLLLERLDVCRQYRPRFGLGGGGLSLAEFQALYSADPFYTWFGLNNALVYTAHRAAGGITSVYRQIGIGVETLFRQIIQDHLGLSTEQTNWSYEIRTTTERSRTLTLDARIEPADVIDLDQRARIVDWMARASDLLALTDRVAQAMRGIVMEVRQGYKSKDSKRQNADMANAAAAYTQGYLPTLVVLSNQIDAAIVERYEKGKWLVLRGSIVAGDTASTYTFARHIIGYDLAGFFQRNSDRLRDFTRQVLDELLQANDG